MSDSFNEKARRGVARRGGLSVSLWSANHSRDGGAVVIPERFLGSFEPRRAFRFVNVARRPTIDGSPTPSPQLSGFRIEREKRFNVARSAPSKRYHRTVGYLSLMNITPRFVTPEMGITAPCLQQQTRQRKGETRGDVNVEKQPRRHVGFRPIQSQVVSQFSNCARYGRVNLETKHG